MDSALAIVLAGAGCLAAGAVVFDAVQRWRRGRQLDAFVAQRAALPTPAAPVVVQAAPPVLNVPEAAIRLATEAVEWHREARFEKALLQALIQQFYLEQVSRLPYDERQRLLAVTQRVQRIYHRAGATQPERLPERIREFLT